MRIKLKEGKQKELILSAKKNLTWEELANSLNVNKQYLSGELKNEKIILPEKLYNSLCTLSNKNYDIYIEKKLCDNWGQSKGGKNSDGSTIRLPEIKLDERLAELVGAVLGDGHVLYRKAKKLGVYHIRIAGDLEKDKDYHLSYLKKLCHTIFGLEAKEILTKTGRFLDIYSKELVRLFISMGINPGNKIKNQSTIPKWVFERNHYIRACLRGLIDTDGCIHKMSNKDPFLIRINFKNNNKSLLIDTRDAFIKLGFHPSKIINNNVFYLSRQQEIKKYLKEIGFSNKKHIERLNKFEAL